MAARDASEATVILGRAAVDAALSDRVAVERFIWDHPRDVRQAVAGIRAFLPDRVADAVAYAANLAPELRAAVAGAWMDGAAGRVLEAGGIGEVDS